jgi:hypothetical protein
MDYSGIYSAQSGFDQIMWLRTGQVWIPKVTVTLEVTVTWFKISHALRTKRYSHLAGRDGLSHL